jgi:hypothetical protein
MTAPTPRYAVGSANLKLSIGCATAFLLPFCAVGVATGVGSVRALLAHNFYNAGFLGIFAIVFGGTGVTLLTLAWRGKAAAEATARRQQAMPDQPWRWRADWEQGRGGSHHAAAGGWLPGYAELHPPRADRVGEEQQRQRTGAPAGCGRVGGAAARGSRSARRPRRVPPSGRRRADRSDHR